VASKVTGPTARRVAALGALLIGLVPATSTTYAAPAAQDVSVSVVIDRGDDATYYVGESMTVCISASRPGVVRLTHSQGTVGSSVLFQDRLTERQCISGPITPPVGQENLRAELLDDQNQVVASQAVAYRTAQRGAAAGAASGSDVLASLLDPCGTVRQYVTQQGVTLLSLRGDPRAQQAVQQAWALLLPVLGDIANNPARVQELDSLITAQVDRALRGQGAFLSPDQARQVLQTVESAAQRGVDSWSRGEQAEPGLLLLAQLWSDGARRASWRAAAQAGSMPGPNMPPQAMGPGMAPGMAPGMGPGMAPGMGPGGPGMPSAQGMAPGANGSPSCGL
jgi:hypothetical protein